MTGPSAPLQLVNACRKLTLTTVAAARVQVELEVNLAVIVNVVVTHQRTGVASQPDCWPRNRFPENAQPPCIRSDGGLFLCAGDARFPIDQIEAWDIRNWLAGNRPRTRR